MTPQPKTKRKLSAKIEKRKALKALSDYIRERDKWTCYTCEKCGLYDEDRASKYDAGHLLSRYWAATLFDEEQIKCQCKRCNIMHENDPEIFKRKWIAENGEKAFEALYQKSKQAVKRTAADYVELRKYFEEKLKEIINVE